MSSTPPGSTRFVVPNSVLWTALLAIAAFAWRTGCQADHDLLRAGEVAGAAKESAERAYGLGASCESRLDVAERRIKALEERIAPPRQQP